MADPVRTRLDAEEWVGRSGRLRLLGFDVEVRSDDVIVTELVRSLFAPLAASGDPEHVLSLVSLHASGLPAYAVHLDGRRVVETPAPSVAFAHLLWEANRQALEHTTDAVLLHAAAVVRDGAAVVLPGRMGAGKSTLAAALVARHGLGYLTDETVAIGAETGLVAQYAKFLSLGTERTAVLPELTRPVPSEQRAYLADQRLVPARAIRADAVAAPAPVGAIVLPVYRRGAPTRVEVLRPAEALLAVAEQAYHVARDGRAVLDPLAALVERVPCVRVEGGDLDAACAAVLDVALAPDAVGVGGA